MYDWDDILIVGDSFCADRIEDFTWPQVLTCKLTNLEYKAGRIPRGRGFPGASWWASRRELLKQLASKKTQVLIVCHTEPFRVPHDTNWAINTRSVFSNSMWVSKYHGNEPVPSEDAVTACQAYYQHILSYNFHLWAIRRWFEELDSLSQSLNIEKVIHLYCFDGEYNQYIFKKGTTLKVPLINYQKKPIWRTAKEETFNHFPSSENIKMGEELCKIIKDYPGDNVVIDKKLLGN